MHKQAHVLGEVAVLGELRQDGDLAGDLTSRHRVGRIALEAQLFLRMAAGPAEQLEQAAAHALVRNQQAAVEGALLVIAEVHFIAEISWLRILC